METSWEWRMRIFLSRKEEIKLGLNTTAVAGTPFILRVNAIQLLLTVRHSLKIKYLIRINYAALATFITRASYTG